MARAPATAVVTAAAAPAAPSLANLPACVEEARQAALARAGGPPDPTDYRTLKARLARALPKLPPAYRAAVGVPFAETVASLGAAGFRRLLAEDPAREGAARLLLDVAQAILQNGEGYEEQATDAFQEVVSDLYDGFLSAEDRRGVKPPDRGVLPPLARWGPADAGPYTWPVTATRSVGAAAPIVSLPAANAKAGLLAWPALAHETAGHDVLDADDGLREELARKVREALAAEGLGAHVATYWSERIEETSADVLGILNMGPAAAVGLVGYFRALNAAWAGRAQLRNVGREDDPHPADIVRGWLAAETVRLLSFAGAAEWGRLLEDEVDRDAGQVRLAGVALATANAKRAAGVVARTIVRTELETLERHALGRIQDWRDEDEATVSALRGTLLSSKPLPLRFGEGTYAAHAVAAAVLEAVAGPADVAALQRRMRAVLKAMHDANPAWGPLYVAHRGDVVARRAYGRRG